jgi:transcriptional regulator
MYLPSHFAAPSLAEAGRFVDQAAAADLVTFDGSKPVASLIPIIWERGEAADAGGNGRVLGHLALANPQWQTVGPDTVALAIVHGPQAYISPSWYPSTARHGRVVPTWNYVAVHLTGPLTIHRDPGWLRAVVTRLTSKHEGGRRHPWAVGDAPPAYIDGQLRGIVGVELTVATVGAKYKLSQNRSEQDRQGALAGLRAEPGPGPAAIASLMAREVTSGRESGA